MRPPGGPPPVSGQQTVRVPQTAGNPAEQPTDMLPPLHGRGRVAPEPDLLTHRENDYGYEDPDSLYDYEYEEDPAETARARRKKIWRRVRRTGYVFLTMAIIGPIIGFFVAYQIVEVPDPKSLAADLDKTVTVKWGNNQTLTTMAPKGRRTLVEYKDIPKPVLNAVFAAEDNTFETNAGFDITGILRAAWNNVTGGQGGGSTITQQYIKKATENEEKTLTRKAFEVVKAYKMSNTMDKNDIITAYLNTIYFGRRANGIVEAARMYYGKELKDINASEAAVLAGVIQSPNKETDDPTYLERRWKYVMDKLVENKWMTPADRAGFQFPTPIERDSGNAALRPDQRLVWEAAKSELNRLGYTEDKIVKNGYTIELTVDPAAQDLAKAAVDQVMAGQPANLRQALVAIDPATGRVIAYYGYNPAKNGYDYVKAWQNAGSSFKPFDLVALLHEGKGLGEVYDGSSPRKFGNSTIRNSENSNACKQCTVAKAMELSINTVFADIAFNTTGTRDVAKAAIEAGIPTNVGNDQIPLEGTAGAAPDVNISIGGGAYQARPVDMAGAYATFAANGTKRKPHLVSKIIDPATNQVVYDGDKSNPGKPAFDQNDPENNAKIARNVTEALIPVVEKTRNGAIKCAEGRECAGKTGTHGCPDGPNTKSSDNCAAWMVGYTPQISTAVWIGADKTEAIQTKGRGNIFGSGLPAELWKKFMDSYLKGKEKSKFTNYVPIGKGPDEGEFSGENSPPNDDDRTKTQTSTQTSQSQSESSQNNTPTKPTKPTGPTLTFPGGGGPGGGGPGGGGPGGTPRNENNIVPNF
jgi:membrane peptidoglycan carboxypeptidase